MTLTFQSKTVHVFFVLFCIKFQVVPITKFMTVRLTTSPRRFAVAIINVLITSQSLSQYWRRINVYCRKGSWKPNANGQMKKGKRTSKDLQNPTLKQKTGGELWRCSTLLVAQSCYCGYKSITSHEWEKNRIVMTRNRTYPWSFVTNIFRIIGSQPFRSDDSFYLWHLLNFYWCLGWTSAWHICFSYNNSFTWRIWR
jgi:hypothetical protein